MELQEIEQSLNNSKNRFQKNNLNLVVYHGDFYLLEKLLPKFPRVDIWLIAHQDGKLAYQWQGLSKPAVIFSDSDSESIQLIKTVKNSESDTWQIWAKRVPLQENILPDPPMERLVNSYYQNLQQTLLAEKKFQSNASCRQCHLLEYETWQNSSHAQSMESIVNTKDKNIDGCKKCHAGRITGSIGCLFCHSISQNHGEYGLKDKSALSDSKKCNLCHTKRYHDQNHPDFEYPKNWLKIAH